MDESFMTRVFNFFRRFWNSAFGYNQTMKSHSKARCPIYPRTTDVKRFAVPDDKVFWDIEFPAYSPVNYTAQAILKGPVWADPDFRNESIPKPTWNELDGKTNRVSHMGKYDIINKVPRNPIGRTGIIGRGTLGKWGPNHAADPLVTRWKRDSKGEIILGDDGKKCLQFVSIERKDCGAWAIPGGMVDSGEVVSETLRREFGEEAMNSLEASHKEKDHIKAAIEDLFSKGSEVYRGYVDDPRNTDNAWMETVAMNFHDAKGDGVGKIKLCAGDDAAKVLWTDVNSKIELYASHKDFIESCVKQLNASW